MTANKQKAIKALIECSTQKEAAKQAGISQRTLTGYLQEREFTTALNNAFTGMIADATRQAQKGMTSAVNVLREIAENANVNPYARINACKVIIESGLKLTEIYDIISRIEALERQSKKGR